MNQLKIYRGLAITGFALFALVLGQAVWAANWTAPTASAPAGNTPPPIWTGSDDQTKTGNLTIGTTLGSSVGNLQVNRNFGVLGDALLGGKVGIGTLTPGRKVTVNVGGAQDGIDVVGSFAPEVRLGNTTGNSNDANIIYNLTNYTLSLGTFGGWNTLNISSGAVGVGMAPNGGTGKLAVGGKIMAVGGDVCTDLAGGKCLSTAGGSGSGSSGVSKIVAGTGVSVSPAAGTGDVTVANTRTVTVIDSARVDGPRNDPSHDTDQATVQCPAGTIVVGGGGACDNGTLGQSEVFAPNGWVVFCQRFTSIAGPADWPQAHVKARCLSYQ